MNVNVHTTTSCIIDSTVGLQWRITTPLSSENVSYALRPPIAVWEFLHSESHFLSLYFRAQCPHSHRGVVVPPSLLHSREGGSLRGAGRRNHYDSGWRGGALHDGGAVRHCFQSERLDCHTLGEEEHKKGGKFRKQIPNILMQAFLCLFLWLWIRKCESVCF